MSKSPYFPNRDNKTIILLNGTICLLSYLTRVMIYEQNLNSNWAIFLPGCRPITTKDIKKHRKRFCEEFVGARTYNLGKR
jgi:hypothetical protein